MGGYRYSFVFFHILDLQKVIEGGPWTFEQSLLVYHRLQPNEDPHLVPLNSMDIWLQVYDVPKGLVLDKVLQSIGNYVGNFVKTDPMNTKEPWRLYVRVRVTMDVTKPLKRRMKIKREGGVWNWVNFKYERLSLFCFVCGRMGHSDRDCEVVYVNPNKEIDRAYGVWLRAPGKNVKNQVQASRWLRNGRDGGQAWGLHERQKMASTTAYGSQRAEAQFMETEDGISEISGKEKGICVVKKTPRK